jgi:protocatechuate 3,4-dioxygenase beta subunit
VRDKATGKPLEGVRIRSWQTTQEVRTDRQGRFELLGCPKGPTYAVEFRPPDGSPYFAAEVRLDDSPGLEPLSCDIELQQGILCRGRLTDRQTGKPIAGAKVEYNALFPSRYINKLGERVANPCSATTTEKDGSYRLAVLPGPGAIGFAVRWVEAESYMPAAVDLKELAALWGDNQTHGDEHFLSTAAGANSRGIMGVNQYHALVLLNPGEKDEAVTRDAAVSPGRVLTGRVVGPDGKPAKGVQVYGLQESQGYSETLAGDSFTVRRLNPRRARALLFYDKAGQRGCYKEVRGDETGPVVVHLGPCGSATGRLVDGDGQPVAGADVEFYRERFLGPGGVRVRTDKDGRFRADGLVPGQLYEGRAPHGSHPLSPLYFQRFTVEPGEVKGLGEAKAERDN